MCEIVLNCSTYATISFYQYCSIVLNSSTYASIVQHMPVLFGPAWAKCLLLLLQCFAAASMLPVPLTVCPTTLWICNKHSLIEQHSAWRPLKGGQHRLQEPVPRPRDRLAVHLRLKLEDVLPADYGHASCLVGTWHTKSQAPLAASCWICLPCRQSRKGPSPIER